jgi:hypothetical protein
MKWVSRIAVLAAALTFVLQVRSTMIEDRLEVLYGSATIEAYSGNGQLSVRVSRIGGYGTSPHWYPVVWHPHQRVSMWPSYDAAFGYALGTGSFWNGSAWEHVMAVPHCCVVLLLLLVPAGRYVVRRFRGPVTTQPDMPGFEVAKPPVAQSRTLS